MTSKLLQRKRTLICTFVALVSGFLSAYIGGQINLEAERQNCQMQPWALKSACKTWVAPGAVWQGSTTGLWVGCILGGFFGGLATRKFSAEDEPELKQMLAEAASLCASDLELTPAQRERVHRFLVLLLMKLGSSSEVETLALDEDELRRLAALAGQKLKCSYPDKIKL